MQINSQHKLFDWAEFAGPQSYIFPFEFISSSTFRPPI